LALGERIGVRIPERIHYDECITCMRSEGKSWRRHEGQRIRLIINAFGATKSQRHWATLAVLGRRGIDIDELHGRVGIQSLFGCWEFGHVHPTREAHVSRSGRRESVEHSIHVFDIRDDIARLTRIGKMREFDLAILEPKVAWPGVIVKRGLLKLRKLEPVAGRSDPYRGRDAIGGQLMEIGFAATDETYPEEKREGRRNAIAEAHARSMHHLYRSAIDRKRSRFEPVFRFCHMAPRPARNHHGTKWHDLFNVEGPGGPPNRPVLVVLGG
jgi:hypothetical protein